MTDVGVCAAGVRAHRAKRKNMNRSIILAIALVAVQRINDKITIFTLIGLSMWFVRSNQNYRDYKEVAECYANLIWAIVFGALYFALYCLDYGYGVMSWFLPNIFLLLVVDKILPPQIRSFFDRRDKEVVRKKRENEQRAMNEAEYQKASEKGERDEKAKKEAREKKKKKKEQEQKELRRALCAAGLDPTKDLVHDVGRVWSGGATS